MKKSGTIIGSIIVVVIIVGSIVGGIVALIRWNNEHKNARRRQFSEVYCI